MSNAEEIRLNKQVARLISLSRREADRLIQEGKIEVNGIVELNPARRVSDQDEIRPLFDSLKHVENKLSICINKPKGYVVSHNSKEGSTVYELLNNVPQKVSAIGRLDKESEGLLILSNDSILPQFIIGENNHCEKEYEVQVDRNLSDETITKLGKSMNILGRKTLPAHVKRRGLDRFTIVLLEGKNRQIRRMVRKVGHKVKSLKRLRISHVRLDTLKSGEWRQLTSKEIQKFKS